MEDVEGVRSACEKTNKEEVYDMNEALARAGDLGLETGGELRGGQGQQA